MVSKRDSLGCTFRSFGTTADMGMSVGAPTVESLLSTAGEGLFSLICDRRTIRPATKLEVRISSENLELLMVAWLNELIYIFDSDTFLVRRCSISVLKDHSANAILTGERYDPDRHSIKTVFKAATYHDLHVWSEAGRWRAVVIFDI